MDDVKQHIDDNAMAVYVDWLRHDGPKPDERILEHVASCSSCKRSILELSEMLDGVDRADGLEKKRGIKLNYILRAVAVLVGVFAVAMIVQFLRPEKTDVELALVDDDSVQIIISSTELEEDTLSPRKISQTEEIEIVQHDTIRYAANFKPNPGLEAMVSARFRSAKQEEVSISLPPEKLVKGETITLKLLGADDKEAEFILISNKGENLRIIVPNESVITMELNFDPGLYYWKLISSDEVILFGKFRLYNKKP